MVLMTDGDQQCFYPTANNITIANPDLIAKVVNSGVRIITIAVG